MAATVGQIVKVVSACGIVLGLIIGVILLAVSFHSIDEDQICLRYSTWDRTVNPNPYLEAGNEFVGVTGSFLCYKKGLQHLEFSKGDSLQSRTREGLDITLEVVVEYKLQPSRLYDLFQLVGTDAKPTLTRIARSTLRNAAGHYDALVYFSPSLANVSEYMTSLLKVTFAERFTDAVAVQIMSVNLPARFDAAVRSVTSARLDREKAKQEREVTIANMIRDNRVREIEKLAKRETIYLEEINRGVEATLRREARITEAETTRDLALLAASTARNSSIVNIEADLEKVLVQREGLLTKARARKQQSIVKFESEIYEARAQASIREQECLATADAVKVAAEANVTIELQKAKALAAGLQDVKSKAADAGGILKYHYLNALRARPKLEVNLDYAKVPFFLEGAAPDVAAAALKTGGAGVGMQHTCDSRGQCTGSTASAAGGG